MIEIVVIICNILEQRPLLRQLRKKNQATLESIIPFGITAYCGAEDLSGSNTCAMNSVNQKDYEPLETVYERPVLEKARNKSS